MKTATGKLKNNQATGRDEVHTEVKKHGPGKSFCEIPAVLIKTE